MSMSDDDVDKMLKKQRNSVDFDNTEQGKVRNKGEDLTWNQIGLVFESEVRWGI